MAKDPNTFVLDDGTKEITIENTFGEEICKLHIRAGEIGIIDRYNALMKDFDAMVKPLSNISLKADGTTEFDKDWNTVREVEQKLIDAIDKLFDMKDAKKLFETHNAFSSINGVFYVEKVLDMLGEVVASTIEEEAKKAEKRTQKYTKDVK